MSNGTPPPTNTPPTNTTVSSEQIQNQSEFYTLLIKSNAEAAKLNELLKTRTDLLGLSAKQLKSETELQNEIATNFLNKITNLDRIKEKQEELNRQLIYEVQSLESAAELQEKIAGLDEEKSRALLTIRKRTEEIDNLEQKARQGKIEDLSQEQQQFLKLLSIKVDGQNTLSSIMKSDRSEKEKRDSLEKAKAINKDFLQLQTKVKSVSEKVAGHIGVAASFGDTFLGSAVDLGERFKQMGTALGEGGMSGFLGDIVGQSFNFKNVLSSIVEFSAKAALDISNLSRDLGAATGYGDKFNKQITTMGAKGNMAGIGFAESATALKTLTTTLSSFNPEAAETNAHVGMTVARLSKLGVTAATSAGVMDVLQRSMGISAEAAADMTAEIATMGKEVGITTTKMMADFKAAQGRLAAFGREGTQVFKELAAQAKATGMEMSKLTEISKTYDTFDAAADSIGKMNAVLGTQLSTLEMLEATDSERIMMIQQQVKMSVGNFDSLDRYTKMYIAQSMGVSDVAEAQRLLNMSTAEYQKTMNGQQKSADIQKELATATEELVPMMQQLKLAGTQVLLVFKPMITFIGGVIGVISELIGGIAWVVQGIGDFIGLTGENGEVMEKIFGAIFTGLMLWKVGVLAAMGPWGLLIAGVTAFFAILHKPGSLSLADGLLDKTIGKSISKLGADAAYAQRDISGLSSEMEGMYDTTHKGGGAIDMRAMANLDATSMAAGLDKVKSAMMELSTLKIDGFLAMSTDGAKSSIVMGSQGVIKSLSEGRLSIDVNMPEIALPPINVVVKVDDVELKKVIDARIEKRATGA